MAIDDFGVDEPRKDVAHKERAATISQNNQLFRSVFTTFDGEKVLRDLMEKFYKYGSHVAGDSHSTAFREGRRDVVIYILDRLEKAENNHEGLDGESV